MEGPLTPVGKWDPKEPLFSEEAAQRRGSWVYNSGTALELFRTRCERSPSFESRVSHSELMHQHWIPLLACVRGAFSNRPVCR